MNNPPPQDDISLLLPAYQPKVLALLGAMTARGFKPRLFETFRSAERCVWAQRNGKSKNGLMSLHRYRVASDIIDAVMLWSNPAFFVALGEEAQKLKLTWGGDWDSNPMTEETWSDQPHVQAIPVARQNIFRSLANDESRNAYLERYFARVG